MSPVFAKGGDDHKHTHQPQQESPVLENDGVVLDEIAFRTCARVSLESHNNPTRRKDHSSSYRRARPSFPIKVGARRFAASGSINTWIPQAAATQTQVIEFSPALQRGSLANTNLEAHCHIHRAALIHLRAVVNAAHGVVAHARNSNRVIATGQHGDVAMWQGATSSDDDRGTASRHGPMRGGHYRRFGGCASSADHRGFANCRHISIRAFHYRRFLGHPVNLRVCDGHAGQKHGAKNGIIPPRAQDIAIQESWR